jgi:hypothetical protein
MPQYLSPGVYVEEVDSSPRPIEGVSTSTAAFVGFTEKVPEVAVRRNGRYTTEKALGQPRLITNWTQYTEEFGSFAEGAYLPYAVYGFFQNGGQRCYVVSVQEVPKMPQARQKLLNGQLVVQAKKAGIEGTRLRFRIEVANGQGTALPGDEAPADATKTEEVAKKGANAGPKPEEAAAGPAAFTLHLERLGDDGRWKYVDKVEAVTLVEETEPGRKSKAGLKYKYSKGSDWVDLLIPAAKPELARLQGAADWHYLEFDGTHLPVPDVNKLPGDEEQRTGLAGLEILEDVSIVCVPDLMMPRPGGDGPDEGAIRAVQDLMVGHCETMGDRVAILDPLPGLTPQQVKLWRMDLPDTSYAALYYPWVEIQDPVRKQPLLIPPSGHVAGIWARTDGERGVHKAPANEAVRYITGLAYEVTKGEQDVLNPLGINCLRTFPQRGTRVWGARTISSNPAWRYLNVRRLFNFVEKSIERDTQWVVFEPNDPDLWARVRRDVTVFLKTVWRSGALFGLTEEEAFYVKCDAELNPPEVREQGQLVVEIGLAPVKPAEFVIFRIMQTSGAGLA